MRKKILLPSLITSDELRFFQQFAWEKHSEDVKTRSQKATAAPKPSQKETHGWQWTGNLNEQGMPVGRGSYRRTVAVTDFEQSGFEVTNLGQSFLHGRIREKKLRKDGDMITVEIIVDDLQSPTFTVSGSNVSDVVVTPQSGNGWNMTWDASWKEDAEKQVEPVDILWSEKTDAKTAEDYAKEIASVFGISEQLLGATNNTDASKKDGATQDGLTNKMDASEKDGAAHDGWDYKKDGAKKMGAPKKDGNVDEVKADLAYVLASNGVAADVIATVVDICPDGISYEHATALAKSTIERYAKAPASYEQQACWPVVKSVIRDIADQIYENAHALSQGEKIRAIYDALDQRLISSAEAKEMLRDIRPSAHETVFRHTFDAY